MDGFGMSFLPAVTFFVMRQNLFLWLYKIWFSPHPSRLLPSGCLFPQFLLEDRVVLCCGMFSPPLDMTWLLLPWSKQVWLPTGDPTRWTYEHCLTELGRVARNSPETEAIPLRPLPSCVLFFLESHPQRCQDMYKVEGKMTRESVCTVLINCHQCWGGGDFSVSLTQLPMLL